MTPTERAEARRLEAAATPGPWNYAHGNDFDHWELWNPESSEFVVQDDFVAAPKTENLEFIAASRTLVPKLLDALDEAERQRDVLAEALREIAHKSRDGQYWCLDIAEDALKAAGVEK